MNADLGNFAPYKFLFLNAFQTTNLWINCG